MSRLKNKIVDVMCGDAGGELSSEQRRAALDTLMIRRERSRPHKLIRAGIYMAAAAMRDPIMWWSRSSLVGHGPEWEVLGMGYNSTVFRNHETGEVYKYIRSSVDATERDRTLLARQIETDINWMTEHFDETVPSEVFVGKASVQKERRVVGIIQPYVSGQDVYGVAAERSAAERQTALRRSLADLSQKALTIANQQRTIPDFLGIGNIIVDQSGKIKIPDIGPHRAVSNDPISYHRSVEQAELLAQLR